MPPEPIAPLSRYVVYPGFVTSRNDGDRHWISASRLLELYGLPRTTRYVVPTAPGFRKMPGDIELRPRFDGHYSKEGSR